MQEIQSIQEELRIPDSDPDVTAELVDDNIRHWLGRIKGPVGTPYEAGIFYLDIKIPDEYPYAPPKVRLVTSNSLGWFLRLGSRPQCGILIYHRALALFVWTF